MILEAMAVAGLTGILNHTVFLVVMRDVMSPSRRTRPRGVPAIPSLVTPLEERVLNEEGDKEVTVPERLLKNGGETGPDWKIRLAKKKDTDPCIIGGVTTHCTKPWTRVLVEGEDEERVTNYLLGGSDRFNLLAAGYRLSNLIDSGVQPRAIETDSGAPVYEIGERVPGPREGLSSLVHCNFMRKDSTREQQQTIGATEIGRDRHDQQQFMMWPSTSRLRGLRRARMEQDDSERTTPADEASHNATDGDSDESHSATARSSTVPDGR